MPTLLSLGHGYCARRLGRDLTAEGWRVIGTTRDPDKADALRAEGAEAVLWPPEDPEALLDAAGDGAHVLASAAPTDDGDPALAVMGPALAARRDRLGRFVYLSTTGVYGDRGGAWIDEGAERRPGTERGARRVTAEDEWLALGAVVLRLAGIYGPGRGPFAKLRAGTARRIIKPGQVFSRIHVDDVAQAIRAAVDRGRPGLAVNVCDDEPAPPQDVLEEAARLLGLPPPPEVPFEAAEMSAMARSFYSESKRTSNRRLREELGVELLHPTYREGLRAVLAEESADG